MMRRAGRLLLSAATFLLGLLVMAWGLRLLVPWRDESEFLDRKLRLLQPHLAEINTIFLGSSRIFRHISPQIFDPIAQAAGLNIHSFNMGADGTYALEDWYNLEQVARTGIHLDWVFVEVSSILPPDFEHQGYSRRIICWHDLPRTVAALRFWWPELNPDHKKRWRQWLPKAWKELQKNWSALYGHSYAFLLHTINLGQGARTLDPLLNVARPDKRDDSVLATNRGYLGLHEETPAADDALYRKQLAEAQSQPVHSRPLSPDAQRNLEAMRRLASKMGARVVALVPPTASSTHSEPVANPEVPLLVFADVNKYPALFTPDVRRDRGHLNYKGAEIFSRILAEEFVRTVQKDCAPPQQP